MENEWNDYPAHTVGLTEIAQAQMHVKEVAPRTPLQYNRVLSSRYGCNVLLKREDLQVVRSFKLRGAYHLIKSLPAEQLASGASYAQAQATMLRESPIPAIP